MDIANLIQTVAIYALPVLFAITVHEAARGYAARYFGDKTAWMMGRITLNPISHIDLVGTIAMPLLLYFATSGAFLFGYAKPIPIDYRALRDPKRNMIWISLAGPASNFAQAIAWTFTSVMLVAAGIDEPFFIKMAQAGVLVNLGMWAFNLFPLPPLAGGTILIGLLPLKQAQWFARIEPWGFFVVMGLVIAGIVSTYWMRPLMTFGLAVINLFTFPLMALFS